MASPGNHHAHRGMGMILSLQSPTLDSFVKSWRFRAADRQWTWSDPTFWTILITTMVGCGLLSTWLRSHRNRDALVERRRYYNMKHPEISSSEEYDSEDLSSSPFDKNMKFKSHTTGDDSPWKRSAVRDEFVDPGLLQKHSSYQTYTTSKATYSSVRTFYCPHPHMNKLPATPSPIPLLVFVHGLGGSLAQFHPLLSSLSNIASCFGIDLPGCGLSSFSPTSWDAYSIEALAELLSVAIHSHLDKDSNQGVVLVAHSLGCSLSAILASSKSPLNITWRNRILGLISICPKASLPSQQESATFRRLLSIPGPIFDLFRIWDRRGGIMSPSVSRFVGKEADPDTRQLQVRFNKQSRTPVWRRMAWGTIPEYKDGQPRGGLPGRDTWAAISTPLLLVAGEADTVTKPAEVEMLLEYFGSTKSQTEFNVYGCAIAPDASSLHHQKPVASGPTAREEAYNLENNDPQALIRDRSQNGSDQSPIVNRNMRVVKSVILPAPASHALLYDRATCRTLSGLIQDFVSQYIDYRLSLGWQLQHLNTSGKWDVKNLAKWKMVAPTSKPLANMFLAMKVLREVDEEHNPVLFSQNWKGKVYAVVDISYQNPVYDPCQLEKGGILYQKHPTVSKIPPTPDETRDFISLIDRLDKEIASNLEKSGSTDRPLIAVHCHYGYNRTGFLIVSYLIERKGYKVQDALNEFERQRPPGIRHEHFIDTLFVRYCVGLKGA